MVRRKHRRLAIVVLSSLVIGSLNWWLLVKKGNILAASLVTDTGQLRTPSPSLSELNHIETPEETGKEYDLPREKEFLDSNYFLASCGEDKCLFRHRSVSIGQEDFATGFLVSRPNKNSNDSIEDGWRISQYLTAAFGIRHFLLSPPQTVSLAAPEAESLFSRAEFPGSEETHKNNNTDHSEPFQSYQDTTVTVQKVRIKPQGSLELRLRHTRDKVRSRLDELWMLASASASASVGKKRNTPSSFSLPQSLFLQTLRSEVSATADLLACEPLLSLDFQIVSDAAGRIYHLDFDRVLSQMGGLRDYNQTKFDAKVQSRIDNSTRLLDTVTEWIDEKEQQNQQQLRPEGNSFRVVPHSPNSGVLSPRCNTDWRTDEASILASRNLSCLATDRVKIARHVDATADANANADADAEQSNRSAKPNHRKGKHRDHRMRHPLLVSLLQRVIGAGFYGNTALSRDTGWDCDAYGDQAVDRDR